MSRKASIEIKRLCLAELVLRIYQSISFAVFLTIAHKMIVKEDSCNVFHTL
ncbi:MAG TPA: hypothetical protein VFE71_02660 [Bacteroidales bacterium]|nr:hypothetical protein [Bacteroidales bacterium]